MRSSRQPRVLTGRMVFAMLVAFFGIVIGVNVVMMQLAIRTLPGTEVDSAYAASLAYEKEIAAARSQEARKWKIDAHVERGSGETAILRIEARDEAGKPMSGLTFEGRFERPTDRRADLSVALAEDGAGVYRGRTPSISAGQWDLVLEGASAGQRMFLSRNRILLN